MTYMIIITWEKNDGQWSLSLAAYTVFGSIIYSSVVPSSTKKFSVRTSFRFSPLSTHVRVFTFSLSSLRSLFSFFISQ